MPSRFVLRCATWIVLLVAATPMLVPVPLAAQGTTALPALPSVFLDTTYTPPTGAIIQVPAGGDFQAALNAAQPGDTIMLAAGATFTGPFTLPNEPGADWIVVRTSAPDSALPLPGVRIDPSYAPVMPKIVVGSEGRAIQVAYGAHHFRFIGIEFHPTPGAFPILVLDLGSYETTPAGIPNNIIFDRCYVHGDPTVGARRGIALNSASSAVIDSYISDIKDTTTDTTALWVPNGSGPFKIVNNYLEASGESITFGGQDPAIQNLVPADIEIRGNHFTKPLAWRVGDPTYAGTPWMVKNLLELKNARRVLVDGNIFEDNWPGGQDGFAVLFTPRNQSGGCPWCTVEDVTFTHNIVRHTTNGVLIHGTDDVYPSGQTQRVLIQNNLFYDVGTFSNMPHPNYQAGGVLLGMDTGGAANVTMDHNTAFQTGDPIINNTPPASPTNFVFTNNIANAPSGSGAISTTSFGPGSVFAGNVIIGGNPSSYPANNFSPPDTNAVGFVNYAGGDYRLAASSPYKHAGTDGLDIGADSERINKATAYAGSGLCPFASPSPPALSVTPRSIDFGTVVNGTSADQSFTIMNPGESTLSGTVTTSPPFSVVSGGSFTLAAGGTQSIVVRFSPNAVGSFGATVNFAWSGGAAGRAVTATGAPSTP